MKLLKFSESSKNSVTFPIFQYYRQIDEEEAEDLFSYVWGILKMRIDDPTWTETGERLRVELVGTLFTSFIPD